jgi:hypothetical protein
MPVGHETASSNGGRLPTDLRARVEMTRNLQTIRSNRRLVHEIEAGDTELGGDIARKPSRRCSVVVAGEPEQGSSPRENLEPRVIACCQALLTSTIVKAVTKKNDHPRGKTLDLRFEPGERFSGVVRRQHLTATGERRTFFEMQIGHDQYGLGLEPQYARRPADDLKPPQ